MLADCGALELLSEEGRRQHLLVLPKACRSSGYERAFRLETAIARTNFLVMTAFHLLLCFV
jgi:hypothetical protein